MPEDQITLTPYTPALRQEWDDFCAKSRNATFLLNRGYMEYHSDRFEDCSLVATRGGRIRALFPAARQGDALVSHPGLTYGGLVTATDTCTAEALGIMESICNRARERGLGRIVYKPVPHIYHRYPAEEDLYALFRLGARLTARNVSAAILMESRPAFSQLRRRGIRKAQRAGITVQQTTDFLPFWDMLSANLAARHGAVPVHTLQEIEGLARAFPRNIRLFTANRGDCPAGGAVIFSDGGTAHVQYIASTPWGRDNGAVDILFGQLVGDTFAGCRWFDFGTSNLDGGRILNASLIHQKEGFGARAVCYDTYTIDL